MIVDDDPDIIQVIERSLQSENYKTASCRDLKSAMELIREINPNLLILDVILPDGNGIEAAASILENQPNLDMYIFLISGNRKSGDDLEKAYQSGVLDYVLKPINLKELSRKIKLIYRITKLKEKQKLAEGKYMHLIKHSNDLIFSIDSKQKILLLNTSFENVTGHTTWSLKNKTFEKIVCAEDQLEWNEYLKAILTNQASNAHEIRILDKDQQIIPLRVFLSKIKHDNEEIGFLGIAKDLSEQKLLNLEKGSGENSRKREMRSWSVLSDSQTSKTSDIYEGASPFKTDPEIYERLFKDYQQILDKSVEQRIYKVHFNGKEKLIKMASEFGFLKASPREVIKLNSMVLKEKMKTKHPRKLIVYHEEARLIMLELMGYLASYYRNRI